LISFPNPTHQSESLVRLVVELEGLEIDLGVKGESGILQSMQTRAAFLLATVVNNRIQPCIETARLGWQYFTV
jgi:Tfp pilus tip-associated adhesin PilY1